MKKRTLLFIAFVGICGITLSSYDDGPAASSQNRTGAQGSLTTCGGAGCHGTATGTIVSITVDSASTPVSHYIPGHVYTINIHGTSTSANSYFGFEFASVSGTGAAQVQAGAASSLPAHIAIDPFSGLNFVEHDTILSATSPGVYDVSFQWTAPATFVGNITLYCTLNAVNGDDIQNTQDISGNTSVVLAAEAEAVAFLPGNINLKAYPNPVTNTLYLQAGNAQPGMYSIQVYDLAGKYITAQNVEINSSHTVYINTGNWKPGVYNVVVEKDGKRQVIPVTKQ